MLKEIQGQLQFNQPITLIQLIDATGCSWQQAKSVIGQLIAAGLCRPTARGYVRVK